MPHTQQVFLAWHRMSFVFKAMSRQSLPSVHSLSWCDALAASPMLILQLGLVWKRWEMSKSPCQQTPVSLFSLGWSKSVLFLLLEMKTELYGCIQLWLTLVLRSAWTEARFTPLARPGNQPGLKHSQCGLFHQLWEAPWTVSTPLKLCHGGLPS